MDDFNEYDMYKLLQAIKTLINSCESNKINAYIKMMITLLIDMLCQLEGSEFSIGFLIGAIKNIKVGNAQFLKIEDIKRY